MSSRRRFNGSERAEMFIAADGHCTQCGAKLEPGWHADHVQPFAHGGETDIENGQALCPRCNLQKGATMKNQWPGRPLREWQREAVLAYDRKAGNDFLAVATPGSGKTVFALHIAHTLLTKGSVGQVIVVVPSDNLRQQWGHKATDEADIELDYAYTNDQCAVGTDYAGVVVTYQQVAANPRLFAHMVRSSPTLAIFDEIHHAGDGNSWGSALRTAFDHTARRLCLSGTPFRSDNCPIPFITYGDGRSVADFSYGYGAAIMNRDCRPVFFPTHDGRMEWMNGAASYSATFADQLDERRASERWRTALRTGWIEDIITTANEKLLGIRNDHSEAGGLIITMDKEHAQQVARIVERKTGRKPVVATCDDPEASANIDRFARSTEPWIVAVKMVSEGVDIPRLRVCVYATNVETELFFRQAVGRVVRNIPDLEDQSAYFYIPSVASLVQYALDIKAERDHELQEEEEKALRELADTPAEPSLNLFMPQASQAIEDQTIIGGESYSRAEIDRARVMVARGNFRWEPAEVARFLRMVESTDRVYQTRESATNSPAQGPRKQTLTEQKKGLRQIINREVNRLAHEYSIEYADIHQRLNHRSDGNTLNTADLKGLQRRLEILAEWKRDGRVR